MMDLRYSNSNKHVGQSWNFPDVLSFVHLYFHVRAKQEKVGDRWCHVIEYPRDAHRVVEAIGDGEEGTFIWVDSSNPAIIVKKESCFTQAGGFIPWMRRTFDSFKDVGDGIWLPMQIQSEGFSHPTDNVKVGTLVSEATCSVNEVKLNHDVSDKDFEYCVDAGEELFFSSKKAVDGRGWHLYRVWAAADHNRIIEMPLDKRSNEPIKQLITEKDPAFLLSNKPRHWSTFLQSEALSTWSSHHFLG